MKDVIWAAVAYLDTYLDSFGKSGGKKKTDQCFHLSIYRSIYQSIDLQNLTPAYHSQRKTYSTLLQTIQWFYKLI